MVVESPKGQLIRNLRVNGHPREGWVFCGGCIPITIMSKAITVHGIYR